MLRLNGRLDRAGRVRSRELLERLGLAERMRANLTAIRRPAATRRRARLIRQPSVVLADEPTASLDATRWSRRSPPYP